MDNYWRLMEFRSIPFCNTYSLHVIQRANKAHLIVIDINGTVYWLNGDRTFEISDFLSSEERNLEEFSLELVNTATVPAAEDTRDLCYLAACSVVYDQIFAPIRYFVQFFSISMDWNIRLWHKSDVNDAPTLSRLTRSSPVSVDRLYWLIFNYSKHALLFAVEPEARALSLIDAVDDMFPALEIGQMSGAVIRADDWLAAGKYRFSVLGYDSGYVVASVCTQVVGTVVDRKMIKFSGPISILRLINRHEDSLSTSVLVSSTLGPVAVWSLTLAQSEVLVWEMRTMLLNSEIYDAILSCAISRDYIFIGNYGEQVLVYSFVDAVNPEFCKVYPILALNIASPVLAIEFLENPTSENDQSAERQLIVLSYKGVHRYAVSAVPDVFETLLTPMSSTHATPPLSGSLPSPVPSIGGGGGCGGLSSGSASLVILQIEPGAGSDSPEPRGSPLGTPWALPSSGYADSDRFTAGHKHKQVNASDQLLWQHSGQSALYPACADGLLLQQQQQKSGHRGMRLTHPLHTSNQHAPQRQISHHEVLDDVKSKALLQ